MYQEDNNYVETDKWFQRQEHYVLDKRQASTFHETELDSIGYLGIIYYDHCWIYHRIAMNIKIILFLSPTYIRRRYR